MSREKNDLTMTFNHSIVNIRVLLLIKFQDGYIFEQHEYGYYFAIGGRVKFNESTAEAALRELTEEIGRQDIELNLSGVIENFFIMHEKEVHELNFVYSGELLENIDLTSLNSGHRGFVKLDLNQIETFNIKPKAISKFLKKNSGFIHLVNRD